MTHLRTRLLHRLLSHTVVVEGISLYIPPGVLDPIQFRSGSWFAQQVAARLSPDSPLRLLDLGCGSGVVGVLAQRQGARVTATDLHPAACRAARRNGLTDVRQGDLLAPVAGERFDRVCFNPPYFPGTPSAWGFSRALYGGPHLEVLQRFLDTVPQALTPAGHGWVVLSDRAPLARAHLLRAGWQEVGAQRVARGEERLGFWEWTRTR